MADLLDTTWMERGDRCASEIIMRRDLRTMTHDDYDRLHAAIAEAWRAGHLDGIERARKVIAGES